MHVLVHVQCMYIHLLDIPKQPTCMNGGYGESSNC